MSKFCYQLIVASLLLSVPTLAQSPSGGGQFPPLTAEQLRILTGLNKSRPNKEFENRLRALSKKATASAPGQASTSGTTSVTIVNTASGLPCDQSTTPYKCTNGMFVTFYFAPNATSVTGTFSYPWPTVLSDGFRLRYESCMPSPNNYRDMPILGVYQHDGYQQANVYVPGDVLVTQGEPFGSCNLVPDDFLATFNVMSAPGSPFRVANGHQNRFETVKMDRATPAVFSANFSGTTGPPAGFHLNAVTGVWTPLQTCNSNPSQCPITTNGQSNSLILYTTGGENIQCDSLPACMNVPEKPGISFKNPAGTNFIRVPTFIGEVYLGQEQWNVPIGTLASNSYTITIVSGIRDLSIQALTVTFGPGN